MSDEIAIKGLSSKNVWDYENGFYWFSDTSRLDKALAHFELYKRIVGLPGYVAEFGVYKCASLIRFASFRRLLETETSRAIVAFDAFGAFPRSASDSDHDREFIDRFELDGGEGLDREDAARVLAHKGFRNIELIPGDIQSSLPAWLGKHPEAHFSLVHVDVDVYAPACSILEACYERVVPGGIIVLDDYNSVEGETRAVNELVAREKLLIEKLPYYAAPSFIVKPV